MHNKTLVIPTIIMAFTCLIGCQKEKPHIDYERYFEFARLSNKTPDFYTKDNHGNDDEYLVIDNIKQNTTNMKAEKKIEHDDTMRALTYLIHFRYEGFTCFNIELREDGLVSFYCGGEGFGAPKKQVSYYSIDNVTAKATIDYADNYAEESIKEAQELREQAFKDGDVSNFFTFVENSDETKNVYYYKEKSYPNDSDHYAYYDIDNKVLNDLKALEYTFINNDGSNSSDFYEPLFRYFVNGSNWSLSISKNYTTASINYPYKGPNDTDAFVSIYYQVDATAIGQIDSYLREQVGADNM